MKKIAVIFGGTSSEKEVSLHTGLAVVEAIKNIYDVTAINLEDDFHDLHNKLFDIDVVFMPSSTKPTHWFLFIRIIEEDSVIPENAGLITSGLYKYWVCRGNC